MNGDMLEHDGLSYLDGAPLAVLLEHQAELVDQIKDRLDLLGAVNRRIRSAQ